MKVNFLQDGRIHIWKGDKVINYFLLPKCPGYEEIEASPSSEQASLRSESIQTEPRPLIKAPEYGTVGSISFRSLLLRHKVTVSYECQDVSQHFLNLQPLTNTSTDYCLNLVYLPTNSFANNIRTFH